MTSSPLPTKGDLICGETALHYDEHKEPPMVMGVQLTLIHLKPGQRLLDVGCGTGSALAALCEEYRDKVELFGVEPSEDMINIARAKLKTKNTRLEVAPAENLPFEDGYFDCVTSSLVMHHLPMDAKREAIKEMWRVLKPNGIVVISDWEKPVTWMGRWRAWRDRKHAFVKENTRGVITDMLRETGFKKLDGTHIQRGVIHHIVAAKA